MGSDITQPKIHRHYYTNVVMVKNSFERLEPDVKLSYPAHVEPVGPREVYQMVEYAYMGCNCGAVMKSRVKVKIEAEEDV